MERRLVDKEGTHDKLLKVPSPISIVPLQVACMYVLFPIKIGGKVHHSNEENLPCEYAI